LHEINSVITKLRERMGMSLFDDGPADARPNMFQTSKDPDLARANAAKSVCLVHIARVAPSGAHAG
jgi:hypothetical protein